MAKKIRFSLMLPSLIDEGARKPYEPTFRFAEKVDRLGYHMATLAHHSFTPETGDPSATFTVLGGIASRTENLRLGTGIYLAGLHHPVTVAEQAATLDQISGGRAVLGVAVGYRDYEYEGFGLDFRSRGRRMSELLSVLRTGWERGRWGHEGEFFTIPDLPVEPACVQKPHMPILVGGSSPKAIGRAAHLGDGWYALPQEGLEQMKVQVDMYRAACDAAGRKPYICLMRNAWIASDAKTVEDEWMGAVVDFTKTFASARDENSVPDPVLDRIVADEKVGFEEFVQGRAIAGSPDMCIREIERWREAIDFDELSMIFGGSTEQGRLEAAVEQFSAEVMPAFD